MVSRKLSCGISRFKKKKLLNKSLKFSAIWVSLLRTFIFFWQLFNQNFFLLFVKGLPINYVHFVIVKAFISCFAIKLKWFALICFFSGACMPKKFRKVLVKLLKSVLLKAYFSNVFSSSMLKKLLRKFLYCQWITNLSLVLKNVATE